MVYNPALEEVLADLSTTDLPTLDEAILQAGMLLERERRYAWADEVAQHPSRWPRGVPREDPEAHRQRIREAYTSILWQDLIEGRLTPDQEDAIVIALLGALDRGTRRTSLVFALGNSGRQSLIPRLTAELRQAIGADAWLVHQTSYTLGDLLYVKKGHRPSQAQRTVFHDVVRAIGEAVTPDRPYPPSTRETGYVPDPREAAVQTLASIAFRFARQAEKQGLPRQRRYRPDVRGIIRHVQAVLPGEIVIFGPYEGPGLRGNELRAPATIHNADGHELSAIWSGCYFDLSSWPPRLGLMLNGVDADELRPGGLFTADLSEEIAISREMSEGSLKLVEHFGEVRRDGLGPDQFALLFQSPEQVRVPMPPGTPLNQDVVDWHQKLDALLKSRRSRKRKE
jgi:hypothetical protein